MMLIPRLEFFGFEKKIESSYAGVAKKNYAKNAYYKALSDIQAVQALACEEIGQGEPDE